MLRPTGSVTKFFVVGSITLIGVCFISAFAYWIAIEVDKNNCYQRLAKSLNASPTFDAVESVLTARIQNGVLPGMSHDEVIAEFSKISPPLIVDKWSLSNGETKELVKLNTCFFAQNDIEFLTIYSSSGALELVKLYVDD